MACDTKTGRPIAPVPHAEVDRLLGFRFFIIRRHNKLHPYCKPPILNLSYRSRRIKNEVRMSSLAYMIFKENETDEIETPQVSSSPGDRPDNLFSSFRKKSKVRDTSLPVQPLNTATVGVDGIDFTILRELVAHSRRDEYEPDLRSILERKVSGFEELWNSDDDDGEGIDVNQRSLSLDDALKGVIYDVLSTEEKESSRHLNNRSRSHRAPQSFQSIPSSDGSLPVRPTRAADPRGNDLEISSGEEADDISGSEHSPLPLTRIESGHSYWTSFSEITLPHEMRAMMPQAPPFHAPTSRDLHASDTTMRTSNHSVLDPYDHFMLQQPRRGQGAEHDLNGSGNTMTMRASNQSASIYGRGDHIMPAPPRRFLPTEDNLRESGDITIRTSTESAGPQDLGGPPVPSWHGRQDITMQTSDPSVRLLDRNDSMPLPPRRQGSGGKSQEFRREVELQECFPQESTMQFSHKPETRSYSNHGDIELLGGYFSKNSDLDDTPPWMEHPKPPSPKHSRPKDPHGIRGTSQPSIIPNTRDSTLVLPQHDLSPITHAEDMPPLVKGRKGMLGELDSSQHALTKNPRAYSPTRAPKPSQSANARRADSHPLAYPRYCSPPNEDRSDDDESSITKSIVGPFVSPDSVPRLFRPRPQTPSQDSNPLLFPQGLDCYPSSPILSTATSSSHTSAPEISVARDHSTTSDPSSSATKTVTSRTVRRRSDGYEEYAIISDPSSSTAQAVTSRSSRQRSNVFQEYTAISAPSSSAAQAVTSRTSRQRSIGFEEDAIISDPSNSAAQAATSRTSRQRSNVFQEYTAIPESSNAAAQAVTSRTSRQRSNVFEEYAAASQPSSLAAQAMASRTSMPCTTVFEEYATTSEPSSLAAQAVTSNPSRQRSRGLGSEHYYQESFRTRLHPREIICITEDEEERVHTGLYTGTINRFQHMHGNGTFWFDSGDVYLGQFEDDMLHGVGIMSIQMDDGSKQVLKGRFRCNEYVGKA